jgi:hypothetical protein
MAFTLQQVFEKDSPKYKVIGIFDLENEIDKENQIIDEWTEFKLKTPIPIKKDHYFALGSRNGKDTNFSYYHEEGYNSSYHSKYYYEKKLVVVNESIEMDSDSAQACFYYTLKLDFKNWSEKTHQNFPLSFRKITPFLLYSLRKELNIPRVLIYHIFKFF